MLRITTPSSTNTYEPSHVELETVTPATNTKNDNDKVSKNNLSSSQLKQTKITAQPNTINQPNLGLNLPEAEDDPLSDLEDRITKRKKINLTIESKSDSEQKKAAQEQIASVMSPAFRANF